jgi:hypothetical protein
MDLGAALALQIICFLQTDAEHPCSAVQWAFVPGPGRGRDTFPDAVARLAVIEKPVVIGALAHPGYVALWRRSAIDAAEWPHIEHTLANQAAILEDLVPQLHIDEVGLVRFEGWGTHIDVPLGELRRWFGEYALTWGWTMGPPTDDSHQARLFAMRRFRDWSPGGDFGPRR